MTGLSSIDLLVFEIGLAELRKADNDYFVASNKVSGWSFNTYKDNEQFAVMLQASHNNFRYKTGKMGGFSIHNKKKGNLGVFVDRYNNQFSLVYNSSIFYTFKGVVSAFDLCPMFEVYNPHIVQVQCRITMSRNFTKYPDFSPV